MAARRKTDYQILWIENRRVRVPDFVPALRKRGYDLHVVSSGKAAREWLHTFTPDLVVLYAASFGTSGYRIAKGVREVAPETLPLLLIASPEAPPKANAPVSYTLTLPFTTRKLLNRIHRLLPSEAQWHRVGAVALDEQRRVVRCHGREHRLTPRMLRLLKVFMARPHQVIPYHDLFREVWETTYLGDIRTLQVHIAWLRRALEDDPRRPRFLVTLRGVGYRFHPNGKPAPEPEGEAAA